MRNKRAWIVALASVAMMAGTMTSADALRRVDRAPVRDLGGEATSMDGPTALTQDEAGRTYVANYYGDSITVYAAGADGDTAPVQTLSGPATMLESPSGIAVGHGSIYVSTRSPRAVLVFDAAADGNVAPERVITGAKTRLRLPGEVAVDRDGRIIVTGLARRNGPAIWVFGPKADGNVAPKRLIEGRATLLDVPGGVDVDNKGRLYVSDWERDAINVYGPGADGNAAPIRRIKGKKTELDRPDGIELDAQANLYVANWGKSVTVYRKGTHGNAKPRVVLEGAKTGLTPVDDVSVDANNRVSVVMFDYQHIFTFKPLVRAG